MKQDGFLTLTPDLRKAQVSRGASLRFFLFEVFRQGVGLCGPQASWYGALLGSRTDIREVTFRSAACSDVWGVPGNTAPAALYWLAPGAAKAWCCFSVSVIACIWGGIYLLKMGSKNYFLGHRLLRRRCACHVGVTMLIFLHFLVVPQPFIKSTL